MDAIIFEQIRNKVKEVGVARMIDDRLIELYVSENKKKMFATFKEIKTRHRLVYEYYIYPSPERNNFDRISFARIEALIISNGIGNNTHSYRHWQNQRGCAITMRIVDDDDSWETNQKIRRARQMYTDSVVDDHMRWMVRHLKIVKNRNIVPSMDREISWMRGNICVGKKWPSWISHKELYCGLPLLAGIYKGRKWYKHQEVLKNRPPVPPEPYTGYHSFPF